MSVSAESSFATGRPSIFPTRQFYETGAGTAVLRQEQSVAIVVPVDPEPAIQITRELVTQRLKEFGLNVRIEQIDSHQTISHHLFKFYLMPVSRVSLDWQASTMLMEADRRVLEEDDSCGQGYVVVATPREQAVYLIGSTVQGVLYGRSIMKMAKLNRDTTKSLGKLHLKIKRGMCRTVSQG